MHTAVYTKMSTKMPTKVEAFSVKCARGLPRTRVLAGNLTVLTKMCTKVCSVSFHMSYFHMFCFLPRNSTLETVFRPFPILVSLQCKFSCLKRDFPFTVKVLRIYYSAIAWRILSIDSDGVWLLGRHEFKKEHKKGAKTPT